MSISGSSDLLRGSTSALLEAIRPPTVFMLRDLEDTSEVAIGTEYVHSRGPRVLADHQRRALCEGSDSVFRALSSWSLDVQIHRSLLRSLARQAPHRALRLTSRPTGHLGG
jgi:hypothetical protein